MAHEVEILVPVLGSKKDATKALRKFRFEETVHIVDTYYFDPLRPLVRKGTRLVEAFRLRLHGRDAKLTYKIDRFRGNEWLYADEHEVAVSDAKAMRSIIQHLGLKPMVIVDNTRRYYRHGHFEIVLEDVKGLGLFLEVEDKRKLKRAQADKAKRDIRSFLASLPIRLGKEENAGKPELMLRKHN